MRGGLERSGKEAVSVFCGLEENYLIMVYYYVQRFIISKHPRRSDCVVD